MYHSVVHCFNVMQRIQELFSQTTSYIYKCLVYSTNYTDNLVYFSYLFQIRLYSYLGLLAGN